MTIRLKPIDPVTWKVFSLVRIGMFTSRNFKLDGIFVYIEVHDEYDIVYQIDQETIGL